MKKVSVVLCTYNGAKFLREQLDSILAQTYPIYEIIAQDDGSTDETISILKEYQQRFDRLLISHNKEKTMGISGNFFSAMRLATGEYIAISDQDDIWAPDKITTQLQTLGEGWLSTGISMTFSAGDTNLQSMLNAHCPLPNYHLIRLLFRGFPGHTILMRRSFLEMLPSDHEIYHVSMYDIDLALAAAAFDKLVYVDKVLVLHRSHTASATYTDSRDSQPSLKNAWHMLWWCVRNYKKARPHALRYLHARQAWLQTLHSPLSEAKEAQKILDAELQNGPLAYLRLTWLMVKNHRVLFQTEGGGVVKIVRAALYPIMQMWNYRMKVQADN